MSTQSTDTHVYETVIFENVVQKYPVLDVRGYSTLALAVSAQGTNASTIFIPEPITVSADLTIPANVTIWCIQGGIITVAADMTLTMPIPKAGPYQIFSGSGTVTLTGPGNILPQWSSTGTGTLADPWTGWATAITWTAGQKYLFSEGYYSYATAPVWAKSGIDIEGKGNVYLYHTGSGYGIDLTGASHVYGAKVRNFKIIGNDNTTHGMYVSDVHHSEIADIEILKMSATGIGHDIVFSVASTYKNLKVSANSPGVSTLPATGIQLTRTSGSNRTTDCTFINPIVEVVSGTGIYIEYGHNNIFIGGTSEGNATGMKISNESQYNNVIGLYCENNTVKDFHVEDGNQNTFQGAYANAGSTGNGTYYIDAGEGNTIRNGLASGITISATATYTGVYDTGVANLTDNGVSSTLLNNYRPDTLAAKANKIPTAITQEAWTAPTLQNSWANVGGGYSIAGYYKDTLGRVHLRGYIGSGTYADGTLLFTLPAGYRPTYAMILNSTTNKTHSEVRVFTDGTVKIYGAGSAYLSMDGLSFETY